MDRMHAQLPGCLDVGPTIIDKHRIGWVKVVAIKEYVIESGIRLDHFLFP